jgi:hypothetical protein
MVDLEQRIYDVPHARKYLLEGRLRERELKVESRERHAEKAERAAAAQARAVEERESAVQAREDAVTKRERALQQQQGLHVGKTPTRGENGGSATANTRRAQLSAPAAGAPEYYTPPRVPGAALGLDSQRRR